jgi:broad specificity phosphatase PhoE
MIKQKHGAAQFKAWRRGYENRPPPVTSFSEYYPGNDQRYVSYVQDTRTSVKESLIRSLAAGKFELHKKFPKSESLKDCMERTIPYFKDKILQSALVEKKNVLVATHENAIRGLLMYLCDIPTDRIAEIEIPTGLPLVYNVEKKCVQLLDDGTGIDPVEKYDFGQVRSNFLTLLLQSLKIFYIYSLLSYYSHHVILYLMKRTRPQLVVLIQRNRRKDRAIPTAVLLVQTAGPIHTTLSSASATTCSASLVSRYRRSSFKLLFLTKFKNK